jgi:hypothetical protein
MNSQSDATAGDQGGEQGGQTISGLRKHLYFYLILLLGTVVVHNFWRAMNTDPNPPAEQTELQRIHREVASANP